MGEQLLCNDVECAITQYGHRVQSLAYVYLKNRYDAEDVAQDVFITYFKKAPKFLTAQKENAWLMTVTANKCRSMLRRKYREEVPLPEDLCYLPPEENRVLLAVLSLEEKYRIPVHLHYYEGWSIEEIGRFLHVRPGTVGSWLSRARGKLKKELEEDYFEA